MRADECKCSAGSEMQKSWLGWQPSHMLSCHILKAALADPRLWDLLAYSDQSFLGGSSFHGVDCHGGGTKTVWVKNQILKKNEVCVFR